MFRIIRSLLHVLACTVGTGLFGQVVNIEGRRFQNDSVPWAGFVDLRYSISENTQRSINFGLGGAVQHIRGKHRWFFINDLAISRVEANSFQNTGFQHVRYNYARDKRWTGEAFAQSQYNKPLALDHRLTLGAGPRVRILNEEHAKLHMGTALMYEHERDSDWNKLDHGRSSSYLSATVRMSELADIAAVVYYQPRLFDASDHRVALEASLLLKLNARFTFESRLNLLQDTGQPLGVPQLSYTWSNRFGFRF